MKSRAEYMKNIRKGRKTFSVLIEKETFDKLEEKLKKLNKTKKEWLEDKIDE